MDINPGEILYIFFLGLVLFFVLRKQLFEPIGKIIQDREDFISDARDFCAKTEADLLEKKTMIENKLSEAASSAYEIRESYRQDGYKERKEALRIAQDDSGKMLEEARSDIRSTVEEAEEKLNKEADIIAGEITKALIERA